MIVIKRKGFTLIELIVVIGIVAATTVILGTNFVKLIGNVGTYEDEVIAKGVAEAAFVFFDSVDNVSGTSCITANMLINNGYISSKQGLLKKYTVAEIEAFSALIYFEDGVEKKIKVYKNNLSCADDDSKIINFEE